MSTTTLTDAMIDTIDDKTAITTTADADEFLLWDASASAHVKITSANRQLDIVSRSVSDLDTLSALTAAGSVLPDGYAVGQLASKCMRLRNSGSGYISMTTSLADTGIDITVPTDTPFILIAVGEWSNAQPVEIAFYNSFGLVDSKSYNGSTYQQRLSLMTSGYETGATTYSIYAQYYSASYNYVYWFLYY